MISMNRGYLYSFLTALLWSTSGLFIKCIHQSAFTILGITSLIALIMNYVYFHRKLEWNMFAVVVGVFQFLMAVTFTIANQLTTIGNAIVLQYSSMIFILIFEFIDKGILPTWNRILVVVLSLIGMLMFFFNELDLSEILGNFLAIISGFFFGLQFYLNTKPQAVPNTSIRIQYYLSATFMLYPIFTQDGWGITYIDAYFLLLAGLFQTAAAGILFAKSIVLISGFSANLICMSEVFLAPLWAYLFLGEKFDTYAFLGALIMIAALFINILMDYLDLKKKEGQICTIQ